MIVIVELLYNAATTALQRSTVPGGALPTQPVGMSYLLYNEAKCMDGVLELLVDKLLSGAEHSLTAMRRKGMALNPAQGD